MFSCVTRPLGRRRGCPRAETKARVFGQSGARAASAPPHVLCPSLRARWARLHCRRCVGGGNSGARPACAAAAAAAASDSPESPRLGASCDGPPQSGRAAIATEDPDHDQKDREGGEGRDRLALTSAFSPALRLWLWGRWQIRSPPPSLGSGLTTDPAATRHTHTNKGQQKHSVPHTAP